MRAELSPLEDFVVRSLVADGDETRQDIASPVVTESIAAIGARESGSSSPTRSACCAYPLRGAEVRIIVFITDATLVRNALSRREARSMRRRHLNSRFRINSIPRLPARLLTDTDYAVDPNLPVVILSSTGRCALTPVVPS